jgi:hypothetical protein
MERYNFTNPLFLSKIEFNMRRFYIIFFLALLTACDDGDVLNVDLEFDKVLERCENDTESYLIYDTRVDPNESLSLIIPRTDLSDLLFTIPTPVDTPAIFPIDGTDVRFNYRAYNRAIITDELCDVISPAGLNIVEDYEATTGTVEVTVTIEDDDGDGVPTAFEGRGELDANGDYSNAEDFDQDGIPDYLDVDDDDDNVLTKDEIDNSDGDNDPTTNPLNTDADLPNGDDMPDYLDKDDDGDGTFTRLEDENGMNGPGDDREDNTAGEDVAHYLNIEETTSYTFQDYNNFENVYTRKVKTHFLVKDIDLEILRATDVDFGILTTIIMDFTPLN